MSYGKLEEEKWQYREILADITSNCNLRCPFCINDWGNIRGNTNMREGTFLKLIQLLPLTKNGGFFFSCFFEPTTHPDFLLFLQKLPASGRSKVFFTTNLAKRLPKETFRELSRVNVHHINISLESLDPSTYEDLRRGAKFDTFIDNLENLVSVFRGYPEAPRIRYITMVFKQNLNEVANLVRVCHERYLADLHELRTPFLYSFAHMDKEWIQRSVISRKEWDKLGKELSKTRFNAILSYPPTFNEPKRKSIIQARVWAFVPAIRASSDGTLCTTWDGESFDINEIDNPYEFFKTKLYRRMEEYPMLKHLRTIDRFLRVKAALGRFLRVSRYG